MAKPSKPYAMFEAKFAQIKTRSMDSITLSFLMEKLGMSAHAQKNWKRDNEAPIYILWAMDGYLSLLPQLEVRPVPPKMPEFTLEEIKELSSLVTSTDATPSLTRKVCRILMALI